MSEDRQPVRLRGRRSPLAGVAAWVIISLYVVGICTNLWLESLLRLRDEQPLEDAMLVLGFGVFALVGALLVAKRPGNLIGWILSANALMVALFPAGDSYAAYVMTTRHHPDALAVLGAWVQSWYWYLLLALALVFLPLLFPDGRLPSRRWLPVAVAGGIGTSGMAVLGMLAETLTGQNVPYEIENPLGVEGLGHVEDLPVFGVLGALLVTGLVGAVASVVVRYRRSRGMERQQMKWFLYAAALIVPIPALDYVPGPVSGLWFGLMLVALPTAIGIAVLKYRLYDIDVIVNRTLVYAALTVSLAAIYLCSVALLQMTLRALTGERSQLTIVASTLLIAALFNPLRRRVQRFIDRRFYRRKYDAAKTLEAFSARLRDETDLDKLGGDLVTVVRETVQPTHASLWLREPKRGIGDAGARP